jgi:predicted RNA-binding protein YlqC (UPF0109 family)
MSVYQNVVEYCVRRLCEEPDAVDVEALDERETIQITVRVAPNDVGKVIGKNGRVVSALRQYLSAIARKNREKVYLKVITE